MSNWITSEEKIFILDRMVKELSERVDALEQQVIDLTALKKQSE